MTHTICFIAFITDAAAMAVTAPNYVLEESLSSQRLWKDTAGQRPPQPIEERAFFEKMWAQNFARSQVEYRMPVEVLTATTPISLNPFADGNFDAQGTVGHELSNYNLAEIDRTEANKKQHPSDMAEAALMRKLYEPRADPQLVDRQVKMTTSDGDTLTVLVKGDNVFGTTVSKSFARPSENGGPIKGVDTVNISIASYRVVEVRKRKMQNCFSFFYATLTHLLVFPVKKAWQVCSILGYIPRRKHPRYHWSLEAIFRLSRTISQGDTSARRLLGGHCQHEPASCR